MKLTQEEYNRMELMDDDVCDWVAASIAFSQGHCIRSADGEEFQHWTHRKQKNLHRKTLGSVTTEQVMGDWKIIFE
jgi:hypothetical protein